MRDIWQVLGIQETNSKRDIKKAYAKEIRNCHPEEKPEEFARLKEAYEMALEFAEHANVNSVIANFEDLQTNSNMPDEDEEKTLGYAEDSDSEEIMEELQGADSDLEESVLLSKLEQYQEQKEVSEKGQETLTALETLFAEEKNRKDQNIWREFFLRDDFLTVQFEEAFLEKLESYLREQSFVSFTDLPTVFMVEILIAYGLAIEEDGCVLTKGSFIEGNLDALDSCANIVASMWNEQEGDWCVKRALSMMRKPVNKSRRVAFSDYHLMCKFAERGALELENEEEWYPTLIKGCHSYLISDTKDVYGYSEPRHVCLLQLYAFWLKHYEVPYHIYEFIYEKYLLWNLDISSYKPYFARLRDIMLELKPSLISNERAHEKKQNYMSYCRIIQHIEEKYRYYKWIIEPSPKYFRMGLAVKMPNVEVMGQAEKEEVDKLLKSEKFIEDMFDENFLEMLSKYKVSQYTAIRLYETYDGHPGCESVAAKMKRSVEEYDKINACLIDEIYQGDIKDIRVECDETAFDSRAQSDYIDMPEIMQEKQRVDVSEYSNLEKAKCILDMMCSDALQDLERGTTEDSISNNTENGRIRLAFCDNSMEDGIILQESCVPAMTQFLNKYGYIHNHYVVLKYGNQNKLHFQRVMAMGLVANQDSVYDILEPDSGYMIIRQHDSHNVKGDTIIAGYIWTADKGTRPITLGEMGELYGQPNLGIRAFHSLEEFIAAMYDLQYVTEVITYGDSLVIERRR